ALGEAAAQEVELLDTLLDPSFPQAGQARPVAPGGRRVRRELSELPADLVQAQADLLREDDEGDPAQDGARIAAVPRARALRLDQAALLVVAQGGGGDPAAARHLPDG